MKKQLNSHSFPILALMLGALGCMTRLCLYLFSTDEKGLLIPWHPVSLVLLALTVAAASLVLVSFRLPGESPAKADKAAGIGALALAAGIALSLTGRDMAMLPEKLCLALGLAAAAALLWAGICNLRGKEPSFLCFAALCLYLLLQLVCSYRSWSGDPQLQNYLWSAAALILLAVTAYYRAAGTVGLGKPLIFRAAALGAVFACLTASAHGEYPLLFAAGGIWAALTARWSVPEV